MFIRDWFVIASRVAFVATVQVFEYCTPIEAISAGDIFRWGNSHLGNITAEFFTFV